MGSESISKLRIVKNKQPEYLRNRCLKESVNFHIYFSATIPVVLLIINSSGSNVTNSYVSSCSPVLVNYISRTATPIHL